MVKATQNTAAAIQDINLIDLKINTFGPFEDQVYAAFPALIKNIRRGNTVLKYKNDKG